MLDRLGVDVAQPRRTRSCRVRCSSAPTFQPAQPVPTMRSSLWLLCRTRGVTPGWRPRGGPVVFRSRVWFGDIGSISSETLSHFTSAAAEPRGRCSESPDWHHRPFRHGAPCTGFDSGEPSCREIPANHTMTPTERNSLCQFWSDSNRTCSSHVGQSGSGGLTWRRRSAFLIHPPPDGVPGQRHEKHRNRARQGVTRNAEHPAAAGGPATARPAIAETPGVGIGQSRAPGRRFGEPTCRR